MSLIALRTESDWGRTQVPERRESGPMWRQVLSEPLLFSASCFSSSLHGFKDLLKVYKETRNGVLPFTEVQKKGKLMIPRYWSEITSS
ncbi:hypothetical protein DVH24_001594 [Malus domestica]|uniref:Uncharacterized protein n=1 Tax=Malus domestica TaxID=3750 RepID=A0A498JZM9_MALDO|nr:hypothetical protein DVH24_001594 [Malus domestica]